MNSRSSPKFQDHPKPRRSHIWPRALHNHYLEERWNDDRLFDVEQFDHHRLLTDPCCGIGYVVDAAKAHGYRVEACDLVDRGYPQTKVEDFLKRERPLAQAAFNPPFDKIEAFAPHALALGASKIALICPVAYLNATHWLKELPFRRALLMTPRPSMLPAYLVLRGQKPKDGRPDYAWLIFEAGYSGKAEIDWLHRDGERL